MRKTKRILYKGVVHSSHVKINTQVALKLAEIGYDVTMIMKRRDETYNLLRSRGVNVIMEPPLPKELLEKDKNNAKDKKRSNMWNVWDNTGRNVAKLFKY